MLYEKIMNLPDIKTLAVEAAMRKHGKDFAKYVLLEERVIAQELRASGTPYVVAVPESPVRCTTCKTKVPGGYMMIGKHGCAPQKLTYQTLHAIESHQEQIPLEYL